MLEARRSALSANKDDSGNNMVCTQQLVYSAADLDEGRAGPPFTDDETGARRG